MESVMSPILSRLVFSSTHLNTKGAQIVENTLWKNQGDGAKADRHRINTQLVQTRDVLEDKAVNRSQAPIGQVAECQRQAVAQAVPMQLGQPFRMGNSLQVLAQLIYQQYNGQHLGGSVGKTSEVVLAGKPEAITTKPTPKSRISAQAG